MWPAYVPERRLQPLLRPLPRTTDAVANALLELRDGLRDLEDRIEALENPGVDNDPMQAVHSLERRLDELESGLNDLEHEVHDR